MKAPESLEIEHEELHKQLKKAIELPGQTGVYAKEVSLLLHEHFKKEEAFALPPLTLLYDLSAGKISQKMQAYIPLCDTLKKNWSEMLEEHQQIKQKLELLRKAAKEENQEEVIKFADNLKLHAQTEEEILYPAAILIGEYLKIKLGYK